MTTAHEAIERLRRVHAGLNLKDAQELYADAWATREDDWVVNAIRDDRLVVSRLLLSVYPKGPRPVSLGVCEDGWSHEGGVLEFMSAGLLHDNRPLYETEADARLARHWAWWDAGQQIAKGE